MAQTDTKDMVLIPGRDFEVIHAALKMVVTGEDYDEVESVRLERAAWEIVRNVDRSAGTADPAPS